MVGQQVRNNYERNSYHPIIESCFLKRLESARYHINYFNSLKGLNHWWLKVLNGHHSKKKSFLAQYKDQ